MSLEHIEGVHYIFDRYAFLNGCFEDGGNERRISPDSPQEDIEEAIKFARTLHHPDRQAKAGKERQEDAERKTRRIADCEKFLLSATLKPLYDAKLEQFRRENPRHVSTNGNIPIDPMASYFDVGALLSDEVLDTSEYEARLRALLNYDEAQTERAAALFKSLPDNPQIRAFYQNALSQKLAYLSELEDAAWAKLGWFNIGEKQKIKGHLLDGEQYMEHVEGALTKMTRNEIPNALAERRNAAQIGLTSMPRLLTAGNNETPAENEPAQALADPAEMEKVMKELTKHARRKFKERADFVREAAAHKQAVLMELIALNPVSNLNEHDPENPLYHIFVYTKGGRALGQFDLDTSTGRIGIGEAFKNEISMAELNAQGHQANAIGIEYTPGTGNPYLSACYLGNKIFKDIQKARKTDPDSQPPPEPL